eukprot:s1505_g4.t4
MPFEQRRSPALTSRAKAEVLPLTARDLLDGNSAAWQVFLDYAASCFPNVGPLAQEDFSLALAEEEILEAGEQVALATKDSLEKLKDQSLYNALGAPVELLKRCELEATQTLMELQLSLLRKSRDQLLEALQDAVASQEQAGAMLCEIRRLKEATLERRAQGQTRRARRLLEETEAAVQRLKDCRQQKIRLARARKARLCRAEDVTGRLSVGVLVFRGRHRLQIQRCQGPGVPLTPSSLCWLRFEAAAPGRTVMLSDSGLEDPEESPPSPEWRRRFEESFLAATIQRGSFIDPSSSSWLATGGRVPAGRGLAEASTAATCAVGYVKPGDDVPQRSGHQEPVLIHPMSAASVCPHTVKGLNSVNLQPQEDLRGSMRCKLWLLSLLFTAQASYQGVSNVHLEDTNDAFGMVTGTISWTLPDNMTNVVSFKPYFAVDYDSPSGNDDYTHQYGMAAGAQSNTIQEVAAPATEFHVGVTAPGYAFQRRPPWPWKGTPAEPFIYSGDAPLLVVKVRADGR